MESDYCTISLEKDVVSDEVLESRFPHIREYHAEQEMFSRVE